MSFNSKNEKYHFKNDKMRSFFRIFPHSDGMRRDTPYFSVFSPNAGKYRQEKTLKNDRVI